MKMDSLGYLEISAELNVPIVRYPGGNFVSGFQVGGQCWTLRIQRPVRAGIGRWRSRNKSQFGLNEFVGGPNLAGSQGDDGGELGNQRSGRCKKIFWSIAILRGRDLLQ